MIHNAQKIKSKPEFATAIITSSNAWNGTQSHHDNTDIEFNTINKVNDNYPVQRLLTWGETKQLLINNIKVIDDKNRQTGIYPVSMKSTGLTRVNKNIKNRTLILLDFDLNGDINQILDPLSSYVYMGWTTHSHQTTNTSPAKHFTNRYRVMLPLLTPITEIDWLSDFNFRIKEWGDLNWYDNNALDETYRNVGQIGFAPSINPKNAEIQLWINDAYGTQFFDLNALPPAATLPSPKTPASKTKSKKLRNNVVQLVQPCNTSIVNIDRVVQRLLKMPNLKHINANHFTSGGETVHRQNIALGLIALGGSYSDFQTLDAVMCKPNSNHNSIDIWNDACSTPDPHTGTIKQLLGPLGRLDCGLSNNTYISKSYQTNWDFEHSVEYINHDLVKGKEGERILLCADMGTGKNHLWENLDFTDDGWRVIVFAPLRTIVHQQGSKNDLANPENKTFTYDQSSRIPNLIANGKLDPAKTILVVDECHNLLLAKYRDHAIAHLEFAINRYDWQQVVFQSATITPDTFEGYMSFDSKIRVVKQTSPNYYYQPIYGLGINNINATIEHILRHFRESNPSGKALILWNDIKNHSELKIKLKKAGLDTDTVNAEKLRDSSKEAFQLAQNIDYEMGEIDVFIGTTALVEGINIKDDIEDAVVIVVGQEPWQYLKQLSGRFRKAKNIYAYHIEGFRKKVVWSDIGKAMWIEHSKYVSEEQTKIVDALININTFAPIDFNVTRHMDLSEFMDVVGLYKNEHTKKYEHHNLRQLWLSAEIEKHEMYETSDNAIAVMLDHGFEEMPRNMLINLIKLNDASHKIINEARNEKYKNHVKNKIDLVYKNFINAKNEINSGGYTIDLESFDLWLGIILSNKFYYDDCPYYYKLREIIKYQLLLEPDNFEALNIQVQKFIKGDIKPAKLETKYGLKLENGVSKKIRAKFQSGQQLTNQQQIEVVEDFITMLMAQEMLVPNRTQSAALENIKKTKRFMKRQKEISLVNGQVVVNVKRPMTLLNGILDMESKTIKVNGKQIQVGIVK
jgi:hypothetical protein